MPADEIKVTVPTLHKDGGVWSVKLTKYFWDWGDSLAMKNERAGLALTKLLKRYRDPDPRFWEGTEIGGQDWDGNTDGRIFFPSREIDKNRN